MQLRALLSTAALLVICAGVFALAAKDSTDQEALNATVATVAEETLDDVLRARESKLNQTSMV